MVDDLLKNWKPQQRDKVWPEASVPKSKLRFSIVCNVRPDPYQSYSTSIEEKKRRRRSEKRNKRHLKE